MKFEYKVLKITQPSVFRELLTNEKELNELGKEGWELVSATPIAKGGFGTTSSLILIFKRKKI